MLPHAPVNRRTFIGGLGLLGLASGAAVVPRPRHARRTMTEFDPATICSTRIKASFLSSAGSAAFPPIEGVTIDRIALPRPGEIVVAVTTGGAEAVRVAQVQADDAYWALGWSAWRS